MDRSRGRRLHTIAGAIVLAAFVVAHLATNASVLWGAAAWERVVGSIERWKLLPVFEVLFILLPLGYHAVYGMRLLFNPAEDTDHERYQDRRLWVLQRISATVVLVFVAVHLWELRVQRLFFGLGTEGLQTTLTAHLSWTWAGVPWLALFYVIGIAAVCFHLANGLYAASALVGRATPAMRRATLLLGGLLFATGLMTVLGFSTGTRLSTSPAADTAPCGSSVAPK